MFKPVSSKTNFPELERDILRWWKETDAFNILRKLRAGSKKWSFVDGPITANNPMGVHPYGTGPSGADGGEDCGGADL